VREREREKERERERQRIDMSLKYIIFAQIAAKQSLVDKIA
jgi:hypothetical protein